MRILLTGASGQLGAYVIDELVHTSMEIAAWSGSRSGTQGGVVLRAVDLAQVDHVTTAFRDARPSIVIHAAALSSIADCFRDPDRASTVNVQGTRRLAELSARAGVRFVYVSTDLVFDGERGNYCETDLTSPLSVYARTKADAEREALEIPRSVVVRLSLMYGPSRIARLSFFDQQVAAMRNGDRLNLFEDEWRSPLDLKTAASALISLARSGYTGVLHIGGPERMSRLVMVERVARCLGLPGGTIVAVNRSSAGFAEPRPRDCSLDSSRWRQLFPGHAWPNLERAIAQMYCNEL
jgi:dTDP-4-dehydrorhamnose reductase